MKLGLLIMPFSFCWCGKLDFQWGFFCQCHVHHPQLGFMFLWEAVNVSPKRFVDGMVKYMVMIGFTSDLNNSWIAGDMTSDKLKFRDVPSCILQRGSGKTRLELEVLQHSLACYHRQKEDLNGIEPTRRNADFTAIDRDLTATSTSNSRGTGE